jgi:hypothetical protein
MAREGDPARQGEGTPLTMTVMSCADGRTPGKLRLREVWSPLSREQLHAALRGVGARWSALSASLREAPAIVLCEVVDEAGESWMLLARASVFDEAFSPSREIGPTRSEMRPNWWVDTAALPLDSFFLLARRATFDRHETCQRGHRFGVALELLPYTCPTCGAPAQPARPLSDPVGPGQVGEHQVVRWRPG